MGRIALNDPTTGRRLATWKEQLGVLGIRLNIAGDQAAWLMDGTADWFWPVAERAGIPVTFLTTGHTHRFARIAERHPQLVLIIDHMGVSSECVRNRAVPAAIDQSVALAKYPNVSVKLSAAALISSDRHRCTWTDDAITVFTKSGLDEKPHRRCARGMPPNVEYQEYRRHASVICVHLCAVPATLLFAPRKSRGWVVCPQNFARIVK